MHVGAIWNGRGAGENVSCDGNSCPRQKTLYFRPHLCLLSTNIIIEKIFLFLWFWLLFLLIVSLVSLAYFCVMAFSRNHNVRMYFLSFAVRIRVTNIYQMLHQNHLMDTLFPAIKVQNKRRKREHGGDEKETDL